ncbi:MAG: hypothetical protein AB7Q17_01950 [Phycisphaerae bacterium]
MDRKRAYGGRFDQLVAGTMCAALLIGVGLFVLTQPAFFAELRNWDPNGRLARGLAFGVQLMNWLIDTATATTVAVLFVAFGVAVLGWTWRALLVLFPHRTRRAGPTR